MLKRAARTLIHSLRVIEAFRRLNRSGVRVLMYHHFPEDGGNLQEQCEHIRRFYNPVTLDDVAASLRTGEALPPNSIAITVDDGYRNFLANGHATFRAFDIPVTMYLVTDFIDGKTWLWWDVVAYLLRNPAEEVCEQLKSLPNEERLKRLEEMIAASDVELPARPPEQFAPLTWDEVRTLSREGVQFGAHTKTHPILSRVSDPQMQDEISSSKQRIESETGTAVHHFCYPNGHYDDFTQATVDHLASSGFQTAVTAEPGFNFPGARPFLLTRAGVEPDTPMPYFIELLAGVRLR